MPASVPSRPGYDSRQSGSLGDLGLAVGVNAAIAAGIGYIIYTGVSTTALASAIAAGGGTGLSLGTLAAGTAVVTTTGGSTIAAATTGGSAAAATGTVAIAGTTVATTTLLAGGAVVLAGGALASAVAAPFVVNYLRKSAGPPALTKTELAHVKPDLALFQQVDPFLQLMLTRQALATYANERKWSRESSKKLYEALQKSGSLQNKIGLINRYVNRRVTKNDKRLFFTIIAGHLRGLGMIHAYMSQQGPVVMPEMTGEYQAYVETCRLLQNATISIDAKTGTIDTGNMALNARLHDMFEKVDRRMAADAQEAPTAGRPYTGSPAADTPSGQFLQSVRAHSAAPPAAAPTGQSYQPMFANGGTIASQVSFPPQPPM